MIGCVPRLNAGRSRTAPRPCPNQHNATCDRSWCAATLSMLSGGTRSVCSATWHTKWRSLSASWRADAQQGLKVRLFCCRRGVEMESGRQSKRSGRPGMDAGHYGMKPVHRICLGFCSCPLQHADPLGGAVKALSSHIQTPSQPQAIPLPRFP